MRLAVTYEPNSKTVWQHFGETEHFLICDLDTMATLVIDNGGFSHRSLVPYLKENGVDVLLAGGMGNHAVELLKSFDIEVVPGVKGDALAAIKAYKEGKLKGNFDVIHDCDCH